MKMKIGELDSIKVSVIIPTHNRPNLLHRAIESVLNQTHKNIEIIIVDDNMPNSNSFYDTYGVYKNYETRGNIIYIKTSGETGGGRARNEGCALATGKYYAFLDDDDIFLPEKIEKQLHFTVKNGLDMSFQDVIWLNEKNEIVEYRDFNYIRDCSQQNLLKEHLMHNIAPSSIYFIEANAFKKTKGFGDLKVGQDIYLMFDCIEKGLRIGYMPGAFVCQFLHKGERLSIGKNKIEGENWWYKEKQRYLGILSISEQRFFRFRHYMILMFACLRSGYVLSAIKYAVTAIFISPYNCIVEGWKYIKNRNKIKKLIR